MPGDFEVTQESNIIIVVNRFSSLDDLIIKQQQQQQQQQITKFALNLGMVIAHWKSSSLIRSRNFY